VTFDLANFLYVHDPWGLLTAAVLGAALGFLIRRIGPLLSNTRTFWQVADGAVFFVPLALLREFEGSTSWERLLATFPLWIVYIAAMRLGNSFEWDRLPGNRAPRPHRRWPESGERRKRDRRLLATPSMPWVGPARRSTDR
jgi:hypothetical protein